MFRPTRRLVFCVRLSLLCLLVGSLGCDRQTSPGAFVARVGQAYLTGDDVRTALNNLPSGLDSTEARRQYIDQWITNELLYQEALQRDLRTQPEVQQQLLESERSVLIDALVAQLFDEEVADPNPADVRLYFERHKEQLRLHEPFVRVRYLFTSAPDSAQLARRLLQQAMVRTSADSMWLVLIRRFAEAPDLSLTLASHYFPESRLFMEQPPLHEHLVRLEENRMAPLLTLDGYAHLLQIADRVPAGSLPELAWVEDQVRRQLTIDARKQMYERQVQRLRTEALSRDALVIRDPSWTVDGTP